MISGGVGGGARCTRVSRWSCIAEARGFVGVDMPGEQYLPLPSQRRLPYSPKSPIGTPSIESSIHSDHHHARISSKHGSRSHTRQSRQVEESPAEFPFTDLMSFLFAHLCDFLTLFPTAARAVPSVCRRPEERRENVERRDRRERAMRRGCRENGEA